MKIDLLDPKSFEGGQPRDQFGWLRENAPVYRHPEPDGPGYWAVTRPRFGQLWTRLIRRPGAAKDADAVLRTW